jgi:hypothetical protein
MTLKINSNNSNPIIMKKLFILVGVLLIAASTTTAQELNLDQVLDKYYKANGFDKLQNVKSIIMTGSTTTWVVMPAKTYRVRPNKYRMERDVNDITGLTVYDGKTGWITAPWSKNPNPQVVAEPNLSELKIQADFDGLLYNWREKGHKVDLVGLEKLGNSDVYRIKVTRSDNIIEYYLIDSKSFLIQKKLGTRNVKGKDLKIDITFSDYRNIDGVMFPFDIMNNSEGQPSSAETQYETIEVDKPVDDNLFIMPVK